MATERNRMLLDFAKDWVLDGDLLRCRACKRAHIASRQDEDFIHRSDCKKNRIGGRPWTALQAILTMLPSGGSVAEQLATVTAQRDKLMRDARWVVWSAVTTNDPDNPQVALRHVKQLADTCDAIAAVERAQAQGGAS